MFIAVTCHLHFWKNDRDDLHATAVIRGWNGYRNESECRKLNLEKDMHFSAYAAGIKLRPFDHEPGALPLSSPRCPLSIRLSPTLPLKRFPLKAFHLKSFPLKQFECSAARHDSMCT